MRASGWHVFGKAALFALFPLAVTAQSPTTAPLSVIDWLDNPAPAAQLPRAPRPIATKPAPLDEPPVTSSGTAPQIITRPLKAGAPRNVGLVPVAITGIQPDLWLGSDIAKVAPQIDSLPQFDLPAANALLYTLLLAESAAPSGGIQMLDMLTRARVAKLMELGAVEPALALVEQAGASTSPALFDLWAELSLLVGTEDDACAALLRMPRLTQDTGLQVFCSARAGDWDNAALTFGSAKALSLLPRQKLDVLDRFLNPDLFENAPPLPTPRQIDPLTFRLFEAIGEALPTGPLPRTYAVADLRDLVGWKSQLEAAERLTRAGALPGNRLLGLYTNRKPAASGSIWDRVKAVQRLDTALSSGSAEAVAKTLPNAWRELQGNMLEVSMAALFHDRLSQIQLTGNPANIQAQLGLLSPEYEIVAANLAKTVSLGNNTALILGVAQDAIDPETFGQPPSAALPRAIYDAFTSPRPRAEWMEMAQSNRLGEALLATLEAMHEGANGDSLSLRDALGTLRALGLEDTARRAALQILILDRNQ
ncbi:hypothetical protein GGR95_002228 [Sulfitobacter undariae]|uniref:Antifreeze protein n=1 Tax=Sulfitobacter undariae TaxID=1563671 RepID=A0A7W6E4I0_9RHOB|nr:hypothetical protein [Sulfitobacter undariae]MBB3994582.1 hypothetical protein [Sulfitobacter undariae]